MRVKIPFQNQQGVAALEFALILPVFLLILLGVIEFSLFFWTRNSLNFAVQEAARLALIDGSVTASQLNEAVLGSLPEFDTHRLVITTAKAPEERATYMQLSARYSWPEKGMTGFLPVNLEAAVATVRIPLAQ